MPRITDKDFVYTPSFDTDLAKKFREIIAQQRKAEGKRPKMVETGKSMVVPINSSNRSINAGA
jgi:hypothetical protein